MVVYIKNKMLRNLGFTTYCNNLKNGYQIFLIFLSTLSEHYMMEGHLNVKILEMSIAQLNI